MKRCPITYEDIPDTENYSKRGLHMLSPQLKDLSPLVYSAVEQRREAIARAGKMSVQGMQPKLSAQLKVKSHRFGIVDQFGHYILKPQSNDFPELPENEALTMSLAAMIGLEVPVHGLVYGVDGKFTYFVKRFDRVGHKQKIALEDFSQLLQASRDTKYESTMEQVSNVILNPEMCSFPRIEAVRFFKLTLFNFLIGNEDMHLKNFSLITREHKTGLAPAYDLLNTTIALEGAKEEMALSLSGKKRKLTRRDLIDYFGKGRLQLNDQVIKNVLDDIERALPAWRELIGRSFLSPAFQKKYIDLLANRCQRLGW